MTWLRWFVLGLMIGVVALLVASWRGSGDSNRTVVDFAAQVEAATLRRPRDDVFAMTTVTIGGETRQAITMSQASRIAWDLTPAAGQWIEVDAGIREDGWTSAAHAVLFRVGLSYDGHYEDLVALTVDPASTPNDRRWVPLRVDLSPYAGRPISLIFNTAPAPGPRDGHVHHAAWGAPRIVE